MNNLEKFATAVVQGNCDGVEVYLRARGTQVVVVCKTGNWYGSVAEWQTALLAALSAKLVEGTLVVVDDYPTLDDWVRAQPEGSWLLAVFDNDGAATSLSVTDERGRQLDDCYERSIVERMSREFNYYAVWLSRYVSPMCEAKIPRGVKVYREK